MRVRGGCLVLALALLGCGGSGGGGGGGAAGASAVRAPASAVSRAHWDRALAALARPLSAPSWDTAGLARWNRWLERAWWGDRYSAEQVLRLAIEQRLDDLVRSQPLVLARRNVRVDLAAAPQLEALGPDTLRMQLPGAGRSWSVSFTLEVGTRTQASIGGIPLTAGWSDDVQFRVENLRVRFEVDGDRSVPERPKLVAVGTPQIDFRVTAQASQPGIQQVLSTLTGWVDGIVRAALTLGAGPLQAVASRSVVGLEPARWGQGGAGPVAPTHTVDLGVLADTISDRMQAEHMPDGMVFGVYFDQPGAGNGQIVAYTGQGDSAIWTGHALMAEAYRYDLTGDPRALAAVDRMLRAYDIATRLSGDPGLLARCIVAWNRPSLSQIRGSWDFYSGTVDGQRYGALDNISRDQYIGTFAGCTQAMLRVPALRARAAQLIDRMLGHFERHDWVALQPGTQVPALARYAFQPGMAWAIMAAGAVADPGRWTTLRDANVDLVRIGWIGTWLSSSDAHFKYYKFNLQHDVIAVAASVVTDPARYRDIVRIFEITRAATGHHQNAWFDGLYAAVVPSRAASLAGRVETELQLWAKRPIRSRPIDFRNDPRVQVALYTPAVGTGNFQQGQVQLSQPELISVYPLPIDWRASTDFLWQRSAFEIVGHGDGRERSPGIDLVLPYWLARSYGLIR